MYTVKIKSTSLQRASRTIAVEAEFDNGTSSHTQTFKYSLTTDLPAIETDLRRHAQQLTDAQAFVESVSANTEVSLSAPEPSTEDKERDAWLSAWGRYNQAKKGIDALQEAGITPSTEEQAAFDELKQWVGANRKAEYTPYL